MIEINWEYLEEGQPRFARVPGGVLISFPNIELTKSTFTPASYGFSDSWSEEEFVYPGGIVFVPDVKLEKEDLNEE